MHGALGKIHRSGALVAFLVEGAALRHVMGHVGDVHAEPVVAVLEPVQRDRVIEVAGVLAVDRHRYLGTEIGPVLEIALLDRRAEAAGFLDRVFSMAGDDSVLSQDDLGIDSRLVDAAEHFDHPSERAARGGRPLGDFDGHHVAGTRVLALAGGNLHVHDQPAVERHHEAPARFVDVEPPDRITAIRVRESGRSGLRRRGR